jgi:hypothetical protein
MAIQLNERDELIFNLIEEHKVLLEKHIAWFISGDQKPVLIRDRLRKLFYLDYLLCQRHPNTLPWWTTPTKPLVYTLSPMAKDIVGSGQEELDLANSDVQRHLLEVANLRMLLLFAQKDRLISNLNWTTCKSGGGEPPHLDAKVSFTHNGAVHQVGILNHPAADDTLAVKLHTALMETDVDTLWIVSRDDDHQATLQKIVSSSESISRSCAFATHQDLYKSGVIESRWENSQSRKSAMFVDSIEEHCNGFVHPQTATA